MRSHVSDAPTPVFGTREAHPARPTERGFTMVESIMALFIVVILFVGVATTLQLAVRNQRDLRNQQQAAALALEYIEFTRSLTWAELALDASPPASMPNISGADMVGAAFNLSADEPLAVDPTNGKVTASNVGNDVVNGQTFDVYMYVTDVGTGLRRVVVLVEWQSRNLAHDYFTTTQISELGAG